MRRSAVIVLALLAVAGVTGCASARGSSRSPAPGRPAAARSATPMKRYRDPLGWTLAYPSTLHLEHSESPHFIDITVDEVTVASFPMRSPIRASQTKTSSSMHVDPPRSRQGAFPSDGIAFRVYRQDGGPGPNLEPPESRFPLRLSSFHHSIAYGSTKPPALERSVTADGRNYTVQAWIGPNASAAERVTLKRIVASLAFPRLHLGQTVGYGFQVFAQASRYPVGSFTRVRVQGQPFYLVHPPGGSRLDLGIARWRLQVPLPAPTRSGNQAVLLHEHARPLGQGRPRPSQASDRQPRRVRCKNSGRWRKWARFAEETKVMHPLGDLASAGSSPYI
jgi:hypothetical protein